MPLMRFSELVSDCVIISRMRNPSITILKEFDESDSNV